MKTLILSSLLVIGMAQVYAQRDHQSTTPLALTTKKGKPASASEKALASNNCTTVLATPADGGNGNSMVMFDMTATSTILIKNFSCSFSGTEIVVEVYTRPGTHVGFEGSNAGWTYHGDTRLSGIAIGTPVEIPVAIYEKLAAGQTMGVCIRVTSGDGLDYTDGTAVGNTLVSDAALTIKEGTGVTDFGGNTFTTRNFNGSVTYCGELACYTDFSNAVTSFTTDNGNDGNVFEITALQDFTLKKFYTNCNGTGGWEVYYRNGSYSGFTTSLSGWILLDSLTITSAGMDMATEIPLPVYMNIAAGQTVSFYITGTGTGADANYFNGTTEGAIYGNYGAFVLKEGLGVAYPFTGTNSPRVWSGSIDYCQQGFLDVSEQQLSSKNVLVYPNPGKDVVHFSIADASSLGAYTIVITDLQGRIVEKLAQHTGSNVSLNTSAYKTGLYLYQLTAQQGTIAMGNFVIE